MVMSQGTAIPESQNGPMPIDVDDSFEQQLTDMLKNGPVLDDTSPTVQGDITDMVPRASSAQTHSIPKTTPSTLPTGAASTPTPTSSAPHSMTNIPLSSPDCNGPPGVRPKPAVPMSQSKLETLKEWSINTFKCTRQMISEKFGRGSRTVDLELETQIEQLRETQKKYAALLRQARALTHHFYNVIQTQRQLGELFADMAQKSPDLQEELNFNAETEKILFHNGEALFGALNFFTSSVNTLCNKTMEDTLMTVKLYEQARIEFDAYRTDMEILQLGPKDANTVSKLDESQKKFLAHKEKFEKLRADVSIKLKFLEENKVKVMHKQLLLFHNAIAAYFSGNQTALESTLKQFNIKLKLPNTEKPSWIEQ